jgi:molybdenum cofactor biosynthesis enzyme MoaA
MTVPEILKFNPQGMRIVGTYRCNRNCPFCYQPTKESVDLDAGKLRDILRELSTYKFVPVYMTYQGGEISAMPNSTDLFMEGLKVYPQVFRKSITTNGTASTKYYSMLKIYGITHFTFSIHNAEDARRLSSTIEKLSWGGFYTIRANCYLDMDHPENVLDVYEFCKLHNIQLTFCEDLKLDATVAFRAAYDLLKRAIPHDFNYYRAMPYKHQDIYISDKYMFWVYHHLDHYDYDNIIILPNGDLTVTFDDVLFGKGCARKDKENQAT